MADNKNTPNTPEGQKGGKSENADQGAPEEKEKKDGEQSQNPPSQDGEDRKFTQADVNRIIKQRLDEEKDRATRAAEEKAAAEKGEWQSLATKRETERDAALADAKALKEQVESISTAINALLESEMKALPAALLDLKPSSGDILQTIDWLTKAKKAAPKLGQPKVPGNNDDPKPRQKGANDEDAQAGVSEYRRRSGIAF